MTHPTAPLAYHLVSRVEPFKVVSPRHIFANQMWEVHEPIGKFNIDFNKLGYSSRTKLTQLRRNYWNPEAAQSVLAHLKKRKSHTFTSLSLLMQANPKDSRSQGYCMEFLDLRATSKTVEATLHYRSTEVLQKLAADMGFLQWVFEQLDIIPDRLTLMMSNCYVSGVFLPSLFQWEDPYGFFEWAEAEAQDFHGLVSKYFYARYRDPEARPTYSPVKRQHRLLWREPLTVKKLFRWMKKRYNL